MVNADNNNGYKWISYKEWLTWLQLTLTEINIAIKKNDAKLG